MKSFSLYKLDYYTLSLTRKATVETFNQTNDCVSVRSVMNQVCNLEKDNQFSHSIDDVYLVHNYEQTLNVLKIEQPSIYNILINSTIVMCVSTDNPQHLRGGLYFVILDVDHSESQQEDLKQQIQDINKRLSNIESLLSHNFPLYYK